MEVFQTGISGVLIIEPKVHKDARGYFFESYNERAFNDALAKVHPPLGGLGADMAKAYPPLGGLGATFVQDNESCSAYGVMRGLHFQRPPHAQAKLVRCVRGAVLDVAVDLRKDSPTYGKHVAVELSEDNHLMTFIPRGCAHGFAVLTETAVFQYKCDNYYAPEAEGGISILDPSLGIDWRIPTDRAILSPKDLRHPLLADFDSPF